MKRSKLTKLGSLFLGLSMALGVGAFIGGKKVRETKAENGTAVYTTNTTSSLTVSGNPTGSSHTFNTNGMLNSGAIQLAGNKGEKNYTLTLSGYTGLKITGLTISAKSNASAGNGSLTFVAGSTTLASSNGYKTFNDSFWNGAWSSSAVDCSIALSNNSYTIQSNENVVLTIANTVNSIYIFSVKVDWETSNTSTDDDDDDTTGTDYSLVTSIGELDTSSNFIMVGINGTDYVAMQAYASGNNCKAVVVPSPSSNTISLVGNEGNALLKFGGSASSGWTIFDGTYYLYAAGGTSNNYMKGVANATNDNAKWTISIASDGKATVITKDSAVTKNTIRYNSTSDLFSCYASGQSDIYFYKEVSQITGDVEVTDVSLDQNSINLLTTDSPVQLVATVEPSNATNKNVSWESSNESVATVVDGLVTPVGVGSATITVTTEDQSKTAECVVNVTTPILVTGVTLDTNSLTFEVGDEPVALIATVTPSDANDKTITWSSSNDAVATVVDGLVTPVGQGSATITVTTHDGSKTAECAVTVNPSSKLEASIVFKNEGYANQEAIDTFDIGSNISGSTVGGKYYTTGQALRIYGGKSMLISAKAGYIITKIVLTFSTGEDSNTISTDVGNYANGTWTGENTSVTFTIGGTSGHRRIASITVFYKEDLSPSINIVGDSISGIVGNTGKLTIETAHMENSEITFSSNNDNIVTVDDEGNYSLVGVGCTTIDVLALYNEEYYQDSVDVNVSGSVTVAKAIALGELLENGETTIYEVTLTGVVSNLNKTGHSFSLIDSTGTLYIYGLYDSDNLYDDIVNEATITVTGNLKVHYSTLQVTITELSNLILPDVSVTGVSLDKTEITLNEGRTQTLTATIEPDNALDKELVWSSSNDLVATVDQTGKVTGVSAGTATITVTTHDGGYTATCTVEVTKGISLEGSYRLLEETEDALDGNYLLVYECVVDDETEYRVFNGLDAASNYVVGELDDSGDIIYDSSMAVVTIASVNGGYSLKINGTDKDGMYISGTSGSNGTNYGSNPVANTITFNDDESNSVTMLCNSTSFRYNATSGQDRFRYFKVATTGASYVCPKLYKLVEDTPDTPTLTAGRYYIMSADGNYGLSGQPYVNGNSPDAINLTTGNELKAFDVAIENGEYGFSVHPQGGGTCSLVYNATYVSGSPEYIRVTDGHVGEHCTWILEPVSGGFIMKINSVGTTMRYLGLFENSKWYGYTDRTQATVVKFVEEGSLAKGIANSILDNVTCDNGVTPPSVEAWDAVAAEYANLTIAYEKGLLTDSSTVTEIQEALAKYDYIVAKYGSSTYADFLDRGPTSPARYGLSLGLDELKDSTWIVAVVAIAGLTAIGGCFFYRKRKQY